MPEKQDSLDAHRLSKDFETTHQESLDPVELSEEERSIERRLVRRIDFLILPLVILVYLMNYMDRYELFIWF